MIYRFDIKSDPPYNSFFSLKEYWDQADTLWDVKEYSEIINSKKCYIKKSFTDNWKPIKVDLLSKAKSRKIKDITDVSETRCPVFSEKARDVLSEFLEENGEFLPIYCVDNDKTYYMYNVLTYVDILDHDKTTYFYYKKYVDFNKLSIFKIVSYTDIPAYASLIFYTQRFLDKIIKYKLKGLYIRPEPFIHESVTDKKAVEDFIKFTEPENLALLGNRW